MLRFKNTMILFPFILDFLLTRIQAEDGNSRVRLIRGIGTARYFKTYFQSLKNDEDHCTEYPYLSIYVQLTTT